MKLKIILIIAIMVGVIGYFSTYTVDETEQVVVTQFRKIVGEPVTTPGLKFKLPFIQEPNYFPKNLLQWDGSPGQIPTQDKTYIYVDTFARWKIVDAKLFFESVRDRETALQRLDDIIDSSVRNLITSHPLIEAVRKTNRKLDTLDAVFGKDSENKSNSPEGKYSIEKGREKLGQEILAQAQPKLKLYGIELVDVKFKRINYVEQVRNSIYDRMIAERKQIAERFRSEGKGEANKILGKKDRDLKRIKSEAYKRAQEIKGEADAEAARIYAETYTSDPEFYSFFRTLEVYREALQGHSALVLSTDSEFFKYLKGYEFSP